MVMVMMDIIGTSIPIRVTPRDRRQEPVRVEVDRRPRPSDTRHPTMMMVGFESYVCCCR
jgi:hypothetical protein